MLPLSAGAAEFTVNSYATFRTDAAPGDGICEAATGSGECTLEVAIQETNALAGPDTINLPAGLHGDTTSITDGVNIVGAGSAITIIDDAGFGIFTDQPVTISGMTIRNGGTFSVDYGIWLDENGDLTLTDVIVKDNQKYGILTHFSGINQLIIENSVIEGNNFAAGTFSFGGGIYLPGTGAVTITDSTIRGNQAGYGGAIYNKGASVTLLRSTISGNVSTGENDKNFGGFGGGAIVVSQSGSLTVVNSTISGNRADTSGGGIVIDDGTVSLYSSTVTDNHADNDTDGAGIGGGIVASNASYSTTNLLELRNSIVAGNGAPADEAADCGTGNLVVNSFGYNLVGTGTDTDCLVTPAAGDQFGTAADPIDPKLGPLQALGYQTATHALLVGSPALDGGNPGGCEDESAVTLSVDQRGLTRELESGSGAPRCDIGSVETFLLVSPNPGPDQVVQFGETVLLDGSGSYAFHGIFSYNWAELPTPSVTLDDASISTPSFVAPNTEAELVFELTVIDNTAEMATDSVTVSVVPPLAIAVIEGVLKSLNKYRKKSAIKKHKKSRKAIKKAINHLDAAIVFYLAGDHANGALEVDGAIADLAKVKKLKSKMAKLIDELAAI